MKKDVSVTPGGITVLGARIGALVAAMFLIFGLTFAYVVLKDTGPGDDGERLLMTMFFVIFTVACAVLLIFMLRIGFGKGAMKDNSLFNMQIDDSESDTKKRPPSSPRPDH